MEISVKLPPNFDLRSASASSEWRFWKCLFEDYLIAVGQETATDRIKLSLLRNMMGPDSTKIILNFKYENDKEALSYISVMAAIGKYVKPKTNEVFERFRFNERKQEENESFENFYTDLRQLIVVCNYNITTQESLEDQLLRDRIVQGVHDKTLQESLLRIENLSLSKAADLCRTREMSKSQVKVMNPTIAIDAAKKFRNSLLKENIFDCRRCQLQHGPRECPAFGKKCSKCGILNHFAVSCKVRPKLNTDYKKVQEVNCAASSEDSSSECLYCGTANTSGKKNSDWFESIEIEGQLIKCKLDTGADISVMPIKIFEKINKKLNLKLRETALNIESFAGERVKPAGMVNLMCKYKNTECFENFVVVNCKTLLLGLPGCMSLNLIKRVHSVTLDKDKEKFILKNIEVFEGIGRLPGKIDIVTKKCEQQICHPSPRLPNCMLVPLKDELQRLLNRKAIAKVEAIDQNAHINRIVIVEKPNGKVRLCLDPTDCAMF